jgi:hypothetical protein
LACSILIIFNIDKAFMADRGRKIKNIKCGLFFRVILTFFVKMSGVGTRKNPILVKRSDEKPSHWQILRFLQPYPLFSRDIANDEWKNC